MSDSIRVITRVLAKELDNEELDLVSGGEFSEATCNTAVDTMCCNSVDDLRGCD